MDSNENSPVTTPTSKKNISGEQVARIKTIGKEHRSLIIRKYQEQIDSLKAENAHLRLQAEANPNSKDALTGVLLRQYGLDTLQQILESDAVKNGLEGGIYLFDIDHFKEVNDTEGHQKGNAILLAIAQCLSAGRREGDIVSRYGGEEFLVVAPGIAKEELLPFGNKLRAIVESVMVNGSKVTISGGVTPFQPGHTVEEHIKWADDALYGVKDNKHMSRNGILMNADSRTKEELKNELPMREPVTI